MPRAEVPRLIGCLVLIARRRTAVLGQCSRGTKFDCPPHGGVRPLVFNGLDGAVGQSNPMSRSPTPGFDYCRCANLKRFEKRMYLTGAFEVVEGDIQRRFQINVSFGHGPWARHRTPQIATRAPTE